MIPRIRPMQWARATRAASMGGNHPAACPSPGHNQLRRISSTAARRLEAQQQQPPGPSPSPAPASSAPQGGRSRRRFRTIFRQIFFLSVGAALATGATMVLSPPPPPEPHSEKDERITALIRSAAAQLPLVQKLSADPEWTSWDAYDDMPAATTTSTTDSSSPSPAPSRRPTHLTATTLSGSRGIGAYQRIFHNTRTGAFLTVIYFGPGTSGWPGVVHGGTLATVLDESLGRCAIAALPARTGMTATLSLRYLAPTLADDFYVVPVDVVPDEDLPAAERGKRDRKVWCRGRVETMAGKVCVEAEGLFVVPKGLKLQRLGGRF